MEQHEPTIDNEYNKCNKSDVVEFIVFTTVFVTLLIIFFTTSIHNNAPDEMNAWGYLIMIALGEIIGFVLYSAVKLIVCKVNRKKKKQV